MYRALMLGLVVTLFAVPLGYYLEKAVWGKLSRNGVFIVLLAMVAQIVAIYMTDGGLYFLFVATLMLGCAISMLRYRLKEASALSERIKREDYKLRCLIVDYLNGFGNASSLPVLEMDVSDCHPQALSGVLYWLSALRYDHSDITSYHNSQGNDGVVQQKRRRTLLVVRS